MCGAILTADKMNGVILFFSVFLLAGLCVAHEKHNFEKKNVLVAHSYHEGLSWSDGQNQGIKESLGQREDIELFIEYLDSKRAPLEDISELFTGFIASKYAQSSFDAIIVSDDNALTLLTECHNSLFPGVPVVFCGVNNFRLELLTQFKGLLTGVVQTLSPAGTIILMRKLQPDLKRVVVVSGITPTARSIRDQVKQTLAEFDTGLSVVWLDGLDTRTLRRRLSELSLSDAVLLCNFNRDAKGVYYSHEQSGRMISEVSKAPVYAMEEHYLGAGIMGGYMVRAIDQGHIAATLCLEILNTGHVPDIDMSSPNRVIFDHTVLSRFNLDGGDLPSSAIFINKPLSFYQQHKSFIRNAAAGFMVLMVAFLGVSYGLVRSRSSEKKIRVSEENLQTTLDSIGDGVITTDIKGKILRINPVARQLTGWKGEQALGHALEEVFSIVDSKSGKLVKNPVAKVLASGEVVDLSNNTELISRDGCRYQISDSAAPIKEADGNITGVVLVFRDVTSDYRIRKALQESEKHYRLFAENAGDLIWTCRGKADKFETTYMNPAVKKMLGYTPEEFIALPRDKRLDAESIKVIDKILAEMKSVEAISVDIRHIHKDGHLIDCELWAQPLLDDKGEMRGYRGRTIDISERKRAELRLAEINSCLVGLGTDYSVNVNALTALCGRLLGATFALYNRLQGELLCSQGQWNTPPGYKSEHKPDGHLCYDLIQRGALKPMLVRNLQSSAYARADTSVSSYGLETYVGYPVACAGEIVGSLCVVYQENVKPSGADLRILSIIASALTAEENRAKVARELWRMQKLEDLGMVAGGIAHDFNNLLGGVFGNLELAKMELPADCPAGSYIKTAYSTIENARSLTGQLLTFAKGGAPELGMVDAVQLVRDNVEFNLHGSNIQVEYDLTEGLWPLWADKGQIGQVVANLVVNARQAMSEGGRLYVEARNISAAERVETTASAVDMVRIVIRDQGAGISPDAVERIFDPYYSTKEEGHGLGLSVANSIVEQHNGFITVKSTLGVGSTFEVHLPTHPENMEAGAPRSAPENDFSAEEPVLRILVMDDDSVIRKLCLAMASYIGHTIDTVADGDAALEQYRQAVSDGRPYDIVIMDLTIRGGMGGEEAIVKLLEIDSSARVIVASGYASDPVMANYCDYGFSGKLAKPYAIKDLMREITRVIGIT